MGKGLVLMAEDVPPTRARPVNDGRGLAKKIVGRRKRTA
jgi:hypothetical protein